MDKQILKRKSDLHLARKLWHTSGVMTMFAIYNFIPVKWSIVVLLTASAIMLPLDFLRQKRPALNRATHRIFGPVMRQHESNSLSGLSYLFLGVLFLLLFFDHHIVNVTLIFLALGDPVASFFGIRYGKDKILGNKTLQGTMAAFVVCTIVGTLYYYFNNLMTERLFIVGPISGMIGAVAELVPVGKLDDNLTFPALTAILIWVLFQLFGGFGI